MPFCCDVTLGSIEVLGDYCGSTDKGYDPKVVLLGLNLQQSMHNFYELFEKYRNSMKNIASGKK